MGLYINDSKTVVVRQGQRHQITGIVVNDRLSVSSDYKRKIRQEIYYCDKHGVISHLNAIASNESEYNYLTGLLGRISYVLSVECENSDLLQYKAKVLSWVRASYGSKMSC